jgi:hypothetical protein
LRRQLRDNASVDHARVGPLRGPSTLFSFARSRLRQPRSRSIAVLRLVLPAVAVLALLSVVVAAAIGAVQASPGKAGGAAPSTELLGARLVGQDAKGHPFVITAWRGIRETAASQQIKLDQPVLVKNDGAPDRTRVTAPTGTYDESNHKLALSGGVKLDGPQGAFTTPAAVFDSKTGAITGGGVQAAGAFGQIRAGSYTAKAKGNEVTYKGGVHSRINVK